jgi:hypothetical protein
MSSNPTGSEDFHPASPEGAAIPGDPFPWAPAAGPEPAAPTDPVPETPPEEPDDELLPRDLGVVD